MSEVEKSENRKVVIGNRNSESLVTGNGHNRNETTNGKSQIIRSNARVQIKPKAVTKSELKEPNPKSLEPKLDRTDGSAGLTLQSRDYEIMRFVLEMKFASLDQLYRKFFLKLKSGQVSVSRAWAEKRIRQLENAGYLLGLNTPTESKLQFVATSLSYQTLCMEFPKEFLPKPSPEIYHPTYAHDRAVTEFRLELEAKGVLTNWISERSLVCGEIAKFGLPRHLAPDGIYTSSPKVCDFPVGETETAPFGASTSDASVRSLAKTLTSVEADRSLVSAGAETSTLVAGDQWLVGTGEGSGAGARAGAPAAGVGDASSNSSNPFQNSSDATTVAFELEVAPKSRERYRKKVEAFVEAMRAADTGQMRFDRVHFLCLTAYAFRALAKETEIYGDLFNVEFREPRPTAVSLRWQNRTPARRGPKSE